MKQNLLSQDLILLSEFNELVLYLNYLNNIGDTMPEEVEQKKYPLPDSKKPFKVDGSAIEYIVIFPKGYTEYEHKDWNAENDDLKKENDDLKKKNQELADQVTELSSKLSALEDKLKKQTVEEIVKMRKALSLDPNEEELSKMSLNELQIVKTTLSQIPAKKEPEVKAKLSQEEQISEEEKIGRELFGDKYVG